MLTIASRENPLYWPARDFVVYALNGQWFYCRPSETGPFAGWFRGSPTFVRDAQEAYNANELEAK